VTGLGVITPLGNNVDTYWNRLIGGASGVSLIEAFDTSRYKSRIAGIVRDFDAEARFGRKEARRMDRFCQYALAAAEQAMEDAGLRAENVDGERMGVYVGS